LDWSDERGFFLRDRSLRHLNAVGGSGVRTCKLKCVQDRLSTGIVRRHDVSRFCMRRYVLDPAPPRFEFGRRVRCSFLAI